ncbi:uncharacterized protein LOC111257095 [Setaria italica]|uniref:uncharacterized protein LOC111257095 n=1 Tax=Setaria italica TaxID=4555 RepID=UPI000BE5E77B|nr:uncharacterized protein LOC111257095 [Setaria italica]
MEDARIMPHRLVKGLPPLAPQVTKIAPLGRDSAISSANPIKNMMFQSFTSKVPESFTFGLLPKAKSVLHNEAGYSLCSSFKILLIAKSGPSLIHGRRNFSSPPGTKNIPKAVP